MKNYRELQVWKAAHEITLAVYRITLGFPKEEQFGLTSQLRRASVSIGAHIAEGCGRDGDSELKRFLNIALGSACEVDYLLLLATDVGCMKADTAEMLADGVLRLRRQLGSFIRRLKE